MPCKSEKRRIGEVDYTITQMPPAVAVPYHFELATILAEVIAPLAQAKSKGTHEAIAEALALAGPAMRRCMTPERFVEVARDWTSSGLVHRTVKGQTELVSFDEHFAGTDAPHLYRVLAAVFEVNFRSFLDEFDLAALASKLPGLSTSGESQETTAPT